MKKGGKILSRRITSEVLSEIPPSSDQCYHGEKFVGIPFMWESQPGTPKLKVREVPMPPLTPPPSYIAATPKRPIKIHSKQQKLLYSVFPTKLGLKNIHIIPRSPASTSSSSSLSASSWSSSSSNQRRVDEEHGNHNYDSPVSTLSFGGGRDRGTKGSKRGCYSGVLELLLGD